MKLGLLLFLAVLLIIFIVFDKVFGNNLYRVGKFILFVFTPAGMVMWLSEIFISKHVSIMQFGLIFTAFCLLSFVIVKFFEVLQNKLNLGLKYNASNGRVVGFSYSLLIVLLFLLFVLGNGYIDTYVRNIYSIP